MKKIFALSLFAVCCFSCDVFANQKGQELAFNTALEEARAGKFQAASYDLPANLTFACEIINQTNGKIEEYLSQEFCAGKRPYKVAFGLHKYPGLLFDCCLDTSSFLELGLSDDVSGWVNAITLFLVGHLFPEEKNKILECHKQGAEALAVIIKEHPYLLRYFNNVDTHLEDVSDREILSLLTETEGVVDSISHFNFGEASITKDTIQCIERLLKANTRYIQFRTRNCSDVETKRVLLELLSKQGGEIVALINPWFLTLFSNYAATMQVRVKLLPNGQVELNQNRQSKTFDISDPALDKIELVWIRA